MKFYSIAILSFILTLYSCKQETEHHHPTSNSKPLIVQPNAGEVWNVFGVKITGKILSEDTDGAYSVIITNTPPNAGPPPHIHQNEEELFYILKGNYTFYCGNQIIDAPEGSLVKLPKGIPHYFKNIDTIMGITINTITPGGFENFFKTIANLSKTKKPTRQEIDSIAKLYSLKFVK